MTKPVLHLFVFADALGWRLAEHYEVLRERLPVRRRCETLFGYSATCDPTILTGVLPQEHGHFSFFVKARERSPFAAFGALGWMPERLAGYHRIRSRLSRWVAQAKGFTGYFQLYSVPFRRLPHLDYTEKRDIYEPGGINGGQETIFQYWGRSGKPWMRSDWRRGDEANLQEVEAEVEVGKVELIYLFTARLDAIMHRYGPWSAEAEAGMRIFEARIEGILRMAESRYREVRLCLFSDHGMAEVTTTSDLRLRFEAQGWRYGRDYVAVWDSTMARFWFEREETREAITSWLAAQPDGTLLDDAQLADWGCLFPDRRYGELFYALPEGSLFVPSFLNLSRVPGMHGYAPEAPDSAASWLCNWDSPPVGQLSEIFSVMAQAADSKV